MTTDNALVDLPGQSNSHIHWHGSLGSVEKATLIGFPDLGKDAVRPDPRQNIPVTPKAPSPTTTTKRSPSKLVIVKGRNAPTAPLMPLKAPSKSPGPALALLKVFDLVVFIMALILVA